MTATQISTQTTPADRIAVGTPVTASNPGGNTVEGTLVGYEGTLALVEWFGPWMFDGARRYVGRFTQVEAAA